ncbi:MAG TPA: hypothetical protein VF788_09265, partial [Pseudonocardiaceae bacterium]
MFTFVSQRRAYEIGVGGPHDASHTTPETAVSDGSADRDAGIGGLGWRGVYRVAGLFRRTAGNRSLHRHAIHVTVGGGPVDRSVTHSHNAYGG